MGKGEQLPLILELKQRLDGATVKLNNIVGNDVLPVSVRNYMIEVNGELADSVYIRVGKYQTLVIYVIGDTVGVRNEVLVPKYDYKSEEGKIESVDYYLGKLIGKLEECEVV